MNKVWILYISGLITLFSFGQNPERELINVDQVDNGIEVQVSDGVYYIQFYSPKIVETTFVPEGQERNHDSHAVVMEPGDVEIIPVLMSDRSIYGSEGIEVTIAENPFQISYSYKGRPVISEKEGYALTDYGEALEFNLTDDEVLYGGGARALGMNRRGNKLQLYNRAHYGYEYRSDLMYYTMPVVLSSKQYLIHFDNAPIGYLDLDSKKNNTLTYETISGRKTYQIVVGDTWPDVIDNYTDLTGKQPMPPRWALGNFSSRFGYHSQYETEATIKAFQEAEIPVDAVILDLYWFGKEIKGTMGNLSVYRDSFPDFEGMVSRLLEKNVKTVVITEPFILTSSDRWEEAVQEDILAKDSEGNPFTYDFYFGNTGLIDVFKPEGKSWFWNIYKEIANMGVQGVWGDLGEPEVHPSELIHTTGTADELHNIYGHTWAGLVYEGYQRDFPEQRPLILMRAGYSGSQRFGLIPWSGDVSRSWGGLHPQFEIALQMGMQGLAYYHSDLGGFAGPNLDDELYTRWLQYGVFQPVFRPHAQEEVPSEPVFRSEKVKILAKKSIELRYRLLPYNYTLAFENNQLGIPLMRPLFFNEPDRKILLDHDDSYLWGNDFLISPVITPKAEEQVIYFPKGSNWFDFYTDTKFQGGAPVIYSLKEDGIPTFVRAGAFIPMAGPMKSTVDYDPDQLEIHYYQDGSAANGKGRLYNDDGITPNAYEKGAYELLTFRSDYIESKLSFDFSAETGPDFKPADKTMKLIVHNINDAPETIFVDGKNVKINWDKTTERLTIPINWNTAKTLKIKIELKK
jgi:alpha-glucosidase (family GH31 glycosyl hydrolase)